MPYSTPLNRPRRASWGGAHTPSRLIFIAFITKIADDASVGTRHDIGLLINTLERY
jgi:hypothetical protein